MDSDFRKNLLLKEEREIKERIIGYFNRGIEGSKNYQFVVSRITDYLKVKGKGLKHIWKYVPSHVEIKLEKNLKKPTYRYNDFMKEKFLDYVRTELEKAQDKLQNPHKYHKADQERNRIQNVYGPEDFVNKTQEIVTNIKQIKHDCIEKRKKLKQFSEFDPTYAHAKITRVLINSIRENKVDKLKEILDSHPPLRGYYDTVSIHC